MVDMRVLFVTSELDGVYKIGGLADVSAALPPSLHACGIDVTVVLPYYRECTVRKPKIVGTIAVPFAGKTETVIVAQTVVPGSNVPLLLFRHEFCDTYRSPTIRRTFLFFSQAVARFIVTASQDGNRFAKKLGRSYDIIHCHDWHTAILPTLLSSKPEKSNGKNQLQTVLTIHNIRFEGWVSGKELASYKLSIPSRLTRLAKRQISVLGEGIASADAVTTVSETYAREILTAQYGYNLAPLLRQKRNVLHGILNGIDTNVWNPSTDQAIAVRYTRKTIDSAKRENRQVLRTENRLCDVDIPLLGYIGRLDPGQKGIELVTALLPELVQKQRAQWIILGTGDEQIAQELTAIAKRFPDYVSFHDVFDQRLARRIYAGCDMMLLPSRYEPCGLVQLLAMRYGTVPVVRRTGGLADTVTDGVTGFLFDKYQANALKVVLERAIDVWADMSAWKRIRRQAMAADWSWQTSARKYQRLYQSLTK